MRNYTLLGMSKVFRDYTLKEFEYHYPGLYNIYIYMDLYSIGTIYMDILDKKKMSHLNK